MARNFDQAYKLEICKRVVENHESVAVRKRLHAGNGYKTPEEYMKLAANF
jgi:hypothetical protein